MLAPPRRAPAAFLAALGVFVLLAAACSRDEAGPGPDVASADLPLLQRAVEDLGAPGNAVLVERGTRRKCEDTDFDRNEPAAWAAYRTEDELDAVTAFYGDVAERRGFEVESAGTVGATLLDDDVIITVTNGDTGTVLVIASHADHRCPM